MRYENSGSSQEDELNSTVEEIDGEIKSEIDDSVALAHKNILNRDSDNWDEICIKWKSTFSIRRQDLKNLSSAEFFKSWSKFSHAKAAELVILLKILYN